MNNSEQHIIDYITFNEEHIQWYEEQQIRQARHTEWMEQSQ